MSILLGCEYWWLLFAREVVTFPLLDFHFGLVTRHCSVSSGALHMVGGASTIGTIHDRHNKILFKSARCLFPALHLIRRSFQNFRHIQATLLTQSSFVNFASIGCAQVGISLTQHIAPDALVRLRAYNTAYMRRQGLNLDHYLREARPGRCSRGFSPWRPPSLIPRQIGHLRRFIAHPSGRLAGTPSSGRDMAPRHI